MARPKSVSEGDHPQRDLWKGSISFGLVNVPVEVVSARERPSLHFTMLDPKTLSPVGYRYYNKSTGEEISRGRTVKAYEHRRGKYVVMTDADFKKANPEATRTIDIDSFVRLDEIDPVFFDRAYYLRPQKGGERAYALLTEAMARSGKVAIATMVMHAKQHLVALIPRGNRLLLELLHFAEDVKELRELESRGRASHSRARGATQEVEMAERLIEGLSSPWDPDRYRDTYRADILKRVAAKVKAGKATELTEDTGEGEEKVVSNVTDLMPLLRRSLASRKARSRAPGRRRASA